MMYSILPSVKFWNLSLVLEVYDVWADKNGEDTLIAVIIRAELGCTIEVYIRKKISTSSALS